MESRIDASFDSIPKEFSKLIDLMMEDLAAVMEFKNITEPTF